MANKIGHELVIVIAELCDGYTVCMKLFYFLHI